MVDELNATYLSKNSLIKGFSRAKINIAVKMASLKKEHLILDFGCGAGWLKNKLRRGGFNVIGYDKTEEHSEIKDYTKIRPDKIFAMDVFEHISKSEIIKIVKNFKKMNPNFELVVSIPTENLLSRKSRKILGKDERVKDHITSLVEILKILKSELKLVKEINFLYISYIAKFKSN